MFCKYMDSRWLPACLPFVPPPQPSQCSVNTHASHVLMSYLSSALRLMFSRNWSPPPMKSPRLLPAQRSATASNRSEESVFLSLYLFISFLFFGFLYVLCFHCIYRWAGWAGDMLMIMFLRCMLCASAYVVSCSWVNAEEETTIRFRYLKTWRSIYVACLAHGVIPQRIGIGIGLVQGKAAEEAGWEKQQTISPHLSSEAAKLNIKKRKTEI